MKINNPNIISKDVWDCIRKINIEGDRWDIYENLLVNNGFPGFDKMNAFDYVKSLDKNKLNQLYDNLRKYL